MNASGNQDHQASKARMMYRSNYFWEGFLRREGKRFYFASWKRINDAFLATENQI